MSAELSGARARRRRALVDEIVAAADELVHEAGLAGLSMRDLGMRVGLHSSSLYQYFPSKLDIYDALFARWHRQLHDWMSSFDRAGDPEQVFRTGSARFTAFCMADPVRYQLLFQRTIPGFEPSADSYTLALEALTYTRTELSKAGLTHTAHVDLWTAVVTGLTDQQISNDPGGDRWLRLVDDAIDMLLDHLEGQKKGRRK